jgi:hypothetical protein
MLSNFSRYYGTALRNILTLSVEGNLVRADRIYEPVVLKVLRSTWLEGVH